MYIQSILLSLCLFGTNPDPLDAPYLGIMVVDLDTARSLLDQKTNKIPETAKGVMAIEVAEYSPAYGKLNELSIIQSVNGKKIRDVAEFNEQIKSMKIGDEIKLDGYGRRQSIQTGKFIWNSRGTSRISPVSKRDFLDNSAESIFDDFTNQTWRTHKSDPGRYSDSISVYFQEKDGKADNLQLRISYRGDDWIFIQQVALKVGDTITVISDDSMRFETEVISGGEVAEWIHIPVDDKIYSTLREICSKFSGRIRRQGRTKLSDRDVTYEELSRLRTMLDLYESLGGKP